MYSISTRFNSIFFHWFVTLAVLASLNHLTGRWGTYNPQLDVKFDMVQTKEFLYSTKQIYSYYKPNWDHLQLNFNLDVKGLKTIDNWNLKQTFVYLQASWNDDNGRNIMVIWDKIIDRSEIKTTDSISIKNKSLKYPIRDMFRGLRGREITISLHAEFMPIFGLITFRKYYETTIKAPEKYTHSDQNIKENYYQEKFKHQIKPIIYLRQFIKYLKKSLPKESKLTQASYKPEKVELDPLPHNYIFQEDHMQWSQFLKNWGHIYLCALQIQKIDFNSKNLKEFKQKEFALQKLDQKNKIMDLSLNPLTVLISFMVFVSYLYQLTLTNETRRITKDRVKEKTSRNSSLTISNTSKSDFYKNMKIPGDQHFPRNVDNQSGLNTQRSMILNTKTSSMHGGPEFFSRPTQNLGFLPQANQPILDHSAPLRRQISFTNTQAMQVGQNMAGQNGFSSQAFASQSNGMPPLFVGFLSNDASMGHIKSLLESQYPFSIQLCSNKASSDLKKEKGSLMQQKKERHFERKRGKFDANMITSSEEGNSDEEMNQEETKKVGVLGKRGRTPSQTSNGIGKVSRGKVFNSQNGEISSDLFKKNQVKLKIDEKAAEINKAAPETPSFQKTQNENNNSISLVSGNFIEKKQDTSTKKTGLFDKIEENKSAENKKDEGKVSPPKKVLDSKKGGLFNIEVKEVPKGGLFDNIGSDKPEKKVESNSITGNGSLFDNQSFTSAPKQGGLFDNLKKNETKPSGSIFDNITTKAKEDEVKKPAATGGLFSNIQESGEQQKKSGGLFDTEKKELKKTPEVKSELTAIKTGGLFDNISNPQPSTSQEKQSSGGLFDNKTSNQNPPTDLFSSFQKTAPSGLFNQIEAEIKPEGEAKPSNLWGGTQSSDNAGLFNTVAPTSNLLTGIQLSENKSSIFQNMEANSNPQNSASNSANPFLNFTASGDKKTLKNMSNGKESNFFANTNSGGGGLFNSGNGSISTFNTGNEVSTSNNPLLNFSSDQNKPGGIFSSLAGGAGQATQPGSLFSNLTGGNAGGTGLFSNLVGSSNTNTNSVSGGVFGNTGGLFGNSTTGGGSGLFGN